VNEAQKASESLDNLPKVKMLTTSFHEVSWLRWCFCK